MKNDFSAFDRYKAYTDYDALCAFSAKPLRKCKRVNTLKCSVSDFMSHAKSKDWTIEGVPWCNEGFYIDREDRSVALGKDMLHLTGATYMQEAASMLPPILLDPKPGERVLDMAAAPGSKSTQIAAMMQNSGVLVCNDMQEKRIWTLMTALNRLGVMNVLVSKKVGQWFGKHMTERFDRVLIDAPCTAQGTVRKDRDALNYTSEHGIGKAAKLQRELLEAAVHAAKIGGRIVYSTCTLAPEENESVIADLFQRYGAMLEVVDIREEFSPAVSAFSTALIEDSHRVQEWLQSQSQWFFGDRRLPFLRLWPQTYDTEGFFCAVLKKTGRTKEPERFEPLRMKQERVSSGRLKEIRAYLCERYGSDMLHDGELLLQDNERMWVTTEDVAAFGMPAPLYAVGLPFGRTVNDAPVFIDHDFALLRGSVTSKNRIDVDEGTLKTLMAGQDSPCDVSLHGHVLLHHNGRCIGRGRAKEGMCKNQLPRWMIQVGG